VKATRQVLRLVPATVPGASQLPDPRPRGPAIDDDVVYDTFEFAHAFDMMVAWSSEWAPLSQTNTSKRGEVGPRHRRTRAVAQ
jgi:hypothetical protein